MSKPKRSKLELRGLLIGLVLGDGCLSKTTATSNSRLSIGHGNKQKTYCIHKLNLVSKLLRIEHNVKDYVVPNKTTSKTYKITQGSTSVHRYLTKLRKLLYVDNKKIVSSKIINYLTPEGLAYWYMDDGGIISSNKRRQIYGTFISTQCFTKEQQELICKELQNKFKFEAKVVTHGKNRYRIKINKTNSKIFVEIIKPYILPEFEYKTVLDYETYVTFRKNV